MNRLHCPRIAEGGKEGGKKTSGMLTLVAIVAIVANCNTAILQYMLKMSKTRKSAEFAIMNIVRFMVAGWRQQWNL